MQSEIGEIHCICFFAVELSEFILNVMNDYSPNNTVLHKCVPIPVYHIFYQKSLFFFNTEEILIQMSITFPSIISYSLLLFLISYSFLLLIKIV